MSNALRAQAFVDGIVRQMVEADYPVEMTHKRDHRPDYLPTDGFCFDDPDYEAMLGQVLVGAWSSKGALVKLTELLLKQLPNQQHRWNIEEVPHSDDLLICKGDHPKGYACLMVPYVPKDRVRDTVLAATALLNTVQNRIRIGSFDWDQLAKAERLLASVLA